MTKLTQKKVAFEWGDKQEAAFQTLKNKLCTHYPYSPSRTKNYHCLVSMRSHKGVRFDAKREGDCLRITTIIRDIQHILDQKELKYEATSGSKMLSDYDCEDSISPTGKANVVADALSRKDRIKPINEQSASMTIGLGSTQT
ncbi:hypothetical protein Tco_1166703 [Tanacetum coccineum]